MRPRASLDADGVEGRHRDELGQCTGQAGDAVFAILRALMRVAGSAVLAEWAPLADAVAALIDDNQVARFEVADTTPDFFDDAGKLVPEDLRIRPPKPGDVELAALGRTTPSEERRR